MCFKPIENRETQDKKYELNLATYTKTNIDYIEVNYEQHD